MLSPYLRRFASWQVYGFFHHLDPVAQKAEPAKKKVVAPSELLPGPASAGSSASQWDLYFLFPLLLVSLSAFNGNVLLPFTAGVPLTWASLSTTPALLYRQVFPPIMWPQTDMAAICAVSASIAIYVTFLRHPWTLHRFVNVGTVRRPRLRIGSSTLSPDSSRKILRLRRRIRKGSFTTLAICVVAISLFLYGNVLINHYYSWTNGHFLFSFVLLFPGYVGVLYALFGLSTFVILASVFTQIRQKRVIYQMSTINDQLKGLKKKTKNAHRKLFTFRRQNWTLNRTVLSICTQLEAYATYWKAALTPFFLNRVILQTYLAYTCFFIDGLIFLQKIAFIYMVVEIDLLLFLLINVCARVVKLNRRIEVASRDFYLLMSAKGAFKGNISQQLKCEALAKSHRLRSYAFQLFDNYRITSRTFYMVFSNLALFFLLVIKNSRH